MKTRKCCRLAGFLVTGLTVFVMGGAVFAADALRIQPTSQDFGTLDEGVPATMLSTIENTGSQEVHIRNVRTN